MPRPVRQLLDGEVYHVLNHARGRSRIFQNERDFLVFVRVLVEGLEKFDVELLCWCLLHSSWSLVLRPRRGRNLSRMIQWVTVTHARRSHSRRHASRGGRIYQGRFKSFPVQSDEHVLRLCRSVEANPLRAGLVKRAEQWIWSSLGYATTDGVRVPLSDWPVARPREWKKIVNEALEAKDDPRLINSLDRGAPFGDDRWSARIARKSGLTSKLRPLGRPKKIPSPKIAKRPGNRV